MSGRTTSFSWRKASVAVALTVILIAVAILAQPGSVEGGTPLSGTAVPPPRGGAGATPDSQALFTLAPISDQSARVGTQLVVPVLAEHPEQAGIRLAAKGVPPGATFTDLGMGKGRLVWSPLEGSEGRHDVTIQAAHGGLLETRTFAIRVDAAQAPYVVALSDRKVAAGGAISFDVSAWDPLERPLMLAVEPLPPGAKFWDHGNGTGRFDWTPSEMQVGTWPLTARASAEGMQGTAAFNLIVTGLLKPPELAELGEHRAIAGQTFRHSIQATHPDGEAVTLRAGGVPSGATFTDHGDGHGSLEWKPGTTHLGRHEIQIRALTAESSATGTLVIDVIREYDFRLTPLAPLNHKLTPGATLQLPVHIANTGSEAITLDLVARGVQTQGQGWRITVTPSSLALEPGESAVATMEVVGTANSVKTIARVTATAFEDAALVRVHNFVVDMPLKMVVELESKEVSFASATTSGIPGEVLLIWADGSRADGLAVSVTQTPPAGSSFATTESGTTNLHGVFRFSFQGDGSAATPGDHVLRVVVARGDTLHIHATGYTVRTA